MCGILGLVERPGRHPSTNVLERLCGVLHHRGPDGSGVAISGRVGFGHTRLSIIGINSDRARQPVVSGGRLLSFNGEIYNFRDLALELTQQGHLITSDSDTEVLFACLRFWGVEKTLSRLDGMFAFAYYDDDEKALWLARDPMGEKSLYWAMSEGRFIFGSEIKVLLASGYMPVAPDLERIDEYFHSFKINGTRTMFRGIRELEPGTTLSWKLSDPIPRVSAYWRLEEPWTGSIKSDDALMREFGERLEGVVRSRMVSDVPIGVLLSGGIDSNSIAEIMLQIDSQQSLMAFFADNENKSVSEAADMERFLALARSRHPKVQINVDRIVTPMGEYVETLRKLTWNYDEPIQFYNSPLLGKLCATAHDRGLKVLFSGEGSDEILYGYSRFSRTEELLGESNEKLHKLRHLYFGGGIENADLIASICKGCGEGPEATEVWQWLDRHADRWPLPELQMLFSQKYRLQTLLQRQDRIGMARSMEIRVPFLAPDFVRWVNALPFHLKYDKTTGRTKVALREVMKDRLPNRILVKQKDGFPTDMKLWLQQSEMHGIVRDLVGDSRSFSSRYLDLQLIRTVVRDHFSGEIRRDVLIWMLIALEIWHQVFFTDVAAWKRSPE